MDVTENITEAQKIFDTIVSFFVNYSFQVIGAIIVLVLGALAAHWISGLALKFLEKNKVDITLARFLTSLLRISIIGFTFITALGKFGISTSPLIAAFSAALFGASFALKEPLSNFCAGIVIIITRPFVVGNTVSVQGVSGVVEEITLGDTRLINEDGVKITVPNSQVVGQILFNSKQNRIVESVIGIGYDASPETAIELIGKVLALQNDVIRTPAPQIGIQDFGDSSINIGYRYWVPTKKFFQTSYSVNLAVFKIFQESKITIPYPQRDVRIVSRG